MSTVRDQHREAMDLADRADMEKRRGNVDTARQFYGQAFKLEQAAATALATRYQDEPSRSILYRSAASLAMDIQQFNEAERLIAAALSGFPPPDIAEELRDLLEQIHLQLRAATDSTEESGEINTFTGELRSADSSTSTSRLQLVKDGLKSPPIIVAAGLLNDIVRPMWEDTVEVTAQRRKNGKFYLVDIKKKQENGEGQHGTN